MSCGGGGTTKISGSGATFPGPLYLKMLKEYNTLTGVQVNYQEVGSGSGIQNLIDATVDFAGTDQPMTDDDEAASEYGDILHIPTCLGAVVVTYNLPNVGETVLKFSPDLIAEIFLGNITKWNDPAIAELNPDAELPDMTIEVVHRAEGSGTTFVFTSYLSEISKDWHDRVGANKSIDWPVGSGAQKNDGVAAQIMQVEGSIGYVELAYANETGMPAAIIENASGNFIAPTVASVRLAANKALPADTKVSLVNTEVEDGYPIASFTWIIFYQEQNYNNRTQEEAEALLDLLWWMTHDGQEYNEELHYGSLPEKAVEIVEQVLKSAVYDGEPIL